MKYTILLASALIAGCGSSSKSKKGNGSSNNEKQVFSSFGLTGTWNRPCQELEASSKQKTRTFSENGDIEIDTIFANKGCSPGDEIIVYKFEYANAREVSPTDLEGYTKVRSESVAATVSVFANYIAEEFNKSAIYGYTDWKPNTPRDISGRKFEETSTQEYSVGTLVYMHFLKEGDYLSFAAYKDNTALKETDNSKRYTKVK